MEDFKPNIGKKVQENIKPETKMYRDELAHKLREMRKNLPEEASQHLDHLQTRIDGYGRVSVARERGEYQDNKEKIILERNVVISHEKVLEKIRRTGCYDCCFRENKEEINSLMNNAVSSPDTFHEKYKNITEIIEVMDAKEDACDPMKRQEIHGNLIRRANVKLTKVLETSDDVQSYINSELFKNENNCDAKNYIVEVLYKKGFLTKDLVDSDLMDYKTIGTHIAKFSKEDGTIFDIYENENERGEKVRELFLNQHMSDSSKVEIFEWLSEHNLSNYIPFENLQELKDSINKNTNIQVINTGHHKFESQINANRVYYENGGKDGLNQLDENGFGIIDKNIFFGGKFASRLHDVASLSDKYSNGEIVAWSTYETIDESRSRGSQTRHRIYAIKKGDVQPSMLFDENAWNAIENVSVSKPIVEDDGAIRFTVYRDGKTENITSEL